MQLNDIKENMNFLDNQLDKFEYLIEIGKDNKGLSESDKKNKNLIIGCASKSWITCTSKDLFYEVKVDSEAHIVRGLLTILQVAVQNKTKDEIINLDGFELLTDIGIGNNITSQRMNGFLSALKKIKDLIYNE